MANSATFIMRIDPELLARVDELLEGDAHRDRSHLVRQLLAQWVTYKEKQS